MEAHELFFGGIPLEPDLDRLDAAYPNLQAGDYLPYEEIGKIIQAPYRENRWCTVTRAWRQRLIEKRNLVLSPAKGVAFYVLSDEQTLEAAPCAVTFVARKLRRERRKVLTVNAQDMKLAARRDHTARLIWNLEAEAVAARRTLETPPEVSGLPRRIPPHAA